MRESLAQNSIQIHNSSPGRIQSCSVPDGLLYVNELRFLKVPDQRNQPPGV
jgi:hypothetical protein